MRPRPERPRLGIGAGVAVISPEGKLLLIQQERPLSREVLTARGWGIPGGGLEADETIEECAIREAFEETGLRVRLSRLLSVDQFWHGSHFEGIGFVFLAEPVQWPQDVVMPDMDGETRFLDYRWIERTEVQSFTADRYELWRNHWPPEIEQPLVRRLDYPE